LDFNSKLTKSWAQLINQYSGDSDHKGSFPFEKLPDHQKSPIAALLKQAHSIDVPYVRLNHWLSLMPCS